MKIKLYLSLLACLFSAFAWSQTRQITGRIVSDSSRDGIAGATVTLKGTKVATASDGEGRYRISVPQNGAVVLQFSSMGFTSQDVNVGNRSVVDVTLVTASATTMNDVVVIGYQAVRRKDVTGSVSSVTAKQIKDVPLASAAQALQGRLAGVQVVSSEGAPGADIIVRVRGGSSITQDNSPLYIVDGVQVDNALNVIAPQDIASVDVAKDASTTSIYGARGANGVVFITTKGGRNGKTQVSYNGTMGWSHLQKKMKVMSPYDFVLWQYERSRGNTTDSTDFARTYGTTWDTLSNYKNIAGVDWQDQVFGRNARFRNHNVSMNGGNQNTTFSLSLTANTEEGILLQSGYSRKLANFKLEHKLSNAIRVGVNMRYMDQEVDGAGTTNSGTRTTNRLRHTINYRPFEIAAANGGIDDFDEDYFIRSSGAINPVLLTQAEFRNQKTKATYITGFLNITPIRNVTFRSTFGYDNTNIRQDQFYSKITSTARNYASLPVASIGQQMNATLTNSNTLQYSLNDWKERHDFSVLAGQEIVERTGNNSYVETRFFPAEITAEKALANMGLGSAPSGSQQPLPTSGINVPYRLASFFGRLNYGYQDKYLFNVNLRSDRSSKFNPVNGSLLFPSGSIAWRISKEDFMKSLPWISDAKLRFGYGAVGNDRIGDLLYMQLYGVTGQYAFNHSIVPGFAPTALANPDLRWETNITRNLGLDVSFLQGRLQFTADLYRNTADNLLLSFAIPPTSGYSSQIRNLGATENKGVELQLNATPIQKRNFSWNANFNVSFNRNKLVSLGGPQSLTLTSGWQGSDGVDDYLVEVGRPLGLMYGFVTDGWYKVEDFNYDATTQTYTLKPGVAVNGVYGTPQPGMLKWKDLDGDGQITADKDRKVIGDANPKFIGGWNNQFTYRNFDMSVFVNFVVGNDVYNANKLEWTDGAFPNLNTLDIMKNRFTTINSSGQRVTDPSELAKLNANAQIWAPVRVQRYWLHSWAIEDASYLRINNLTLGYTLPTKFTQKAKISSLRLFGTVNNLAVFSNYSGYDPDVTARRANPLTPGVDFAAYPRSRTWVFGANVNF